MKKAKRQKNKERYTHIKKKKKKKPENKAHLKGKNEKQTTWGSENVE